MFFFIYFFLLLTTLLFFINACCLLLLYSMLLLSLKVHYNFSLIYRGLATCISNHNIVFSTALMTQLHNKTGFGCTCFRFSFQIKHFLFGLYEQQTHGCDLGLVIFRNQDFLISLSVF